MLIDLVFFFVLVFIFLEIWYNITVATLSVMDITQDSGS